MNTQTATPKLTTSAMIASFADPGQKTTSAPFGHALARLAEERPEIVGLSADLAKYTDMHIFRDAHPDRFFQIGMAEQAMLGAAAGMAEVGLVPFASTYAVFATRRAYDFLCLDIAEPALNVNVVGGLPGLTTGYGPSHQATEDLAILRGMPNLTIVDPCDSVDIEQAVPALAAHPGPTYMRLLRGKVPTVLDEYDYQFELGKAAELRTGRDVVLISTGLMTMRALTAAERLEADNVDVAVLHVPTIKPLDTQAILRAAADTDRLIVTMENHTIVGGLAEAVAATLAFAGKGRRIAPIGLPDEFLAAGALPTLHDRYGLSTDEVVARIKIELGATAHGHGRGPPMTNHQPRDTDMAIDPRLGCSTISFRRWPLSGALAEIKAQGFGETDLGSLPGVCDQVPIPLPLTASTPCGTDPRQRRNGPADQCGRRRHG